MVGTKEAAALLECSEERVRRMIRNGELRAEKVRGRFGPEYRIDRALLPNGAAKKPRARNGRASELEPPVSVSPAPEPVPDIPPAPEPPHGIALAPEPEPKETAAEVEVARLREERDQWQQLWGEAQEALGRLSADAERARMLEARADGVAQAEARAQAEEARAQAEEARARAVEARAEALVEAEARARAEMEAAHRREREMARQEREARDLVEQARRRVDEVGRQMEEVLRRATGIAEEEAAGKAALEASRQEKEQLRREVARLRERARRWAMVSLVATAVALTAVVGLLVR